MFVHMGFSAYCLKVQGATPNLTESDTSCSPNLGGMATGT